MAALHRVGESAPSFLFAWTMIETMRAARTGHGSFVDRTPVEVDFTLTPTGVDVRTVGMGGDGPACEFRVVGQEKFDLSSRFVPLRDGRLRVDRRWVSQDLSLPCADYFAVAIARGARGIGTPVALVDAIGHHEDPVVVAGDAVSTTYHCQIASSALRRAVGEDVVGEYADPDAWENAEVVVDATGLPIRVASLEDPEIALCFSGWGTTPVVRAPSQPVMRTQEWLHFLQSRPEN